MAYDNYSKYLFKHVSAPPRDSAVGANYVGKDDSTHWNIDKHLFKHVSDPPEDRNDRVKFAANDALTNRNVGEHMKAKCFGKAKDKKKSLKVLMKNHILNFYEMDTALVEASYHVDCMPSKM